MKIPNIPGTYEIRKGKTGDKVAVRLEVSGGRGTKGTYLRKKITIKVKDPYSKAGLKQISSELIKLYDSLKNSKVVHPKNYRLKEFVSLWSRDYAQHNIAKTTHATYLEYLNSRILPEFGEEKLHEITTLNIMQFISSLTMSETKHNRGKILSHASVNYVIRVFKNVMERAVEWQMIETNPLSTVKKLKEAKTSGRTYSRKEFDQVVKALEGENLKWRVYFLLALTCGLRRGELLGLTWDAVDFNESTVFVNIALHSTSADGEYIGDLKTKSSNRVISLPKFVVEQLQEYKICKEKEKELVGGLWEGYEYDLIFSNDYGRPHDMDYPNTWWRRFISRHKLPVSRPHDLRHTSATLMIEDGAQLKEVSDRLGHASVKTTADIYIHNTAHTMKASAGRFDKFFNEMNTKKPNS